MKSRLMYRFLSSCVLIGSVFLPPAVSAGKLLGPEVIDNSGLDKWIWYEEVSSDNLPWLMDMQCAYFSMKSVDGPYYEFRRRLGYSSSIVPPDKLPGYRFKQWVVERTLADRQDSAVYLYAQWEKVSEAGKIRFNINDNYFLDGTAVRLLNSQAYPASGTMDDLKCTTGKDVVLPSNTFKRKGFDFGGWATAANFPVTYADGAVIKAKDLPSDGKDLELFAVWKAKKVSITLDFQKWPGTSKDKRTSSYVVGYAFGVSAFDIVSGSAYVFDGWHTNPTGGARVDNTTCWVPTKDTTYYLHWRYKVCTIKYKANGGEGSMPSQSFTMGIGQKLSLNQFRRKGYYFCGWAKSSDGKVVYADGEKVLLPTAIDGGVVTLYAKWKKIEPDGGPYTETVAGIEWTFYVRGGKVEDFAVPQDTKGSIMVPSALGGRPVTCIGDYAFKDCSGLKSVTIPSGIRCIGYGAFYGCSGLKGVTIPSGVTSIDDCAFYECSGLESVTIPSSVTSIGAAAFAGCSGLESLTIPSSVTRIGEGAFSDCSGLKSVTIPSSVTSIGEDVFCYCSGLKSVTIPSSVTSIGYGAFYGCSGLKGVTIPPSVTSIGEWAFALCEGLTSVIIPSSVTSIGEYAFNECGGLRSVTMPSGVTSVGAGVFYLCSGLESVTIPSGVTSIGKYAFRYCERLMSMRFDGNAPAMVDGEAFDHIASGCTAYVPKDSTGWGVEIPGEWCGINIAYRMDSWKLVVKSNNTKYGSVSGSGTYEVGEKVALKATAKSGYAFAGWYADKACTKKLNPRGYDNREPKIKYTMPTKATTVYAKFISKSSDKKALKFSSTATAAAKKTQKASAGSSFKLSLGAKSATAVTWSASKLPSGLKIDKATGKITGTPTVSGKYVATVTVKSAAGNKISQKVMIYVTVPSGYYGTFDGYALVNNKTAAYMTFTSDKYGKVSGKVTYKGKGYSFKADYSSTSSTRAKVTPKIKIGSTTYKPAVTVEKLADGITVSEARGEQKGKFIFVAQKKPGLIKSKKVLAGLIDQPVKISNKQYADAKLPKSSDKLTLKFVATDVVKVTGKLKGKSVSFSTTVIYCRAEVTEAGDVYTAEAALVEPKSGYSRLATFTLTVGADGKVTKKVSFGKIKAEE